jgi:monoamine oxidase
MNRRSFLWLSAAPVTSGLQVAPRPQAPPDRADQIVIVGAGLAGLQAATILRKAGRPVVVLEARPFPGGRVKTIRAPFAESLYAEAGPIRIPDVHQTVLTLARAHQLNLVPFESPAGSPVITVRGITARVPEDLSKVASALALKPDERGIPPATLLQRYAGTLPDLLRSVTPNADDYAQWRAYDAVTWPEWLRSRGASAGAVTLMTLGGDSRELSALYVLRQIALLQKTSQFYKIQGGMDRLPRAVAAALGSVVRYNAAVTRIDRGNGSIRVDFVEKGRATSIRARRVILAIPFSTLRRVEIRPPFPAEKTKAVRELSYFPATRLLLQSRSPFWQESGLNGSARTDQPAEIWDCTYDLAGSRGILGATVGGALGRRLANVTRDEAVKMGADLVVKTFTGLRRTFERGVAYRWARDPWARGAFAIFSPGQMTSMMSVIAPADGRVHFAGEHTSSWMGWMEGALQSGERAANEVLTAT